MKKIIIFSICLVTGLVISQIYLISVVKVMEFQVGHGLLLSVALSFI
jgi:hypothetical protein